MCERVHSIRDVGALMRKSPVDRAQLRDACERCQLRAGQGPECRQSTTMLRIENQRLDAPFHPVTAKQGRRGNRAGCRDVFNTRSRAGNASSAAKPAIVEVSRTMLTADQAFRRQRPLLVSDRLRGMLQGQRSTSAEPVAWDFQVASDSRGNKDELDRTTQLVRNELADYAGAVSRSARR
jgi:hypothetical protein